MLDSYHSEIPLLIDSEDKKLKLNVYSLPSACWMGGKVKKYLVKSLIFLRGSLIWRSTFSVFLPSMSEKSISPRFGLLREENITRMAHKLSPGGICRLNHPEKQVQVKNDQQDRK